MRCGCLTPDVPSTSVDTVLESDGLRLWAHVARPASDTPPSGLRPGLVLAHGFPTGPRWSESSGKTYPEFADRLAGETDWTVLAFNFRGTGSSQGDFSLAGWQNDLRAAISHMRGQPDVGGVWLAGFRTGAALAICAAADDPEIRGVAAMSPPADFADWAADVPRFLETCRALGVIRSAAFPSDVVAWAQELKEIRAIAAIDHIPPRPILLVHGTDDDVVPMSEARALADAAEDQVELRLISGAGHRLRHDPRAVAVLLGWLDRQTL